MVTTGGLTDDVPTRSLAGAAPSWASKRLLVVVWLCTGAHAGARRSCWSWGVERGLGVAAA